MGTEMSENSANDPANAIENHKVIHKGSGVARHRASGVPVSKGDKSTPSGGNRLQLPDIKEIDKIMKRQTKHFIEM